MNIVCINCPLGCQLSISRGHDGSLLVTGNDCPNGEKYAAQEMTRPERVLATTVKTVFNDTPRISVRTREAIPLELLFKAMQVINRVVVDRPVFISEILIENLLGTGVPLVATSALFPEGAVHD